MLKVIIHYFTGTGNTAHAVKVLAEKLDAAGHSEHFSWPMAVVPVAVSVQNPARPRPLP